LRDQPSADGRVAQLCIRCLGLPERPSEIDLNPLAIGELNLDVDPARYEVAVPVGLRDPDAVPGSGAPWTAVVPPACLHCAKLPPSQHGGHALVERALGVSQPWRRGLDLGSVMRQESLASRYHPLAMPGLAARPTRRLNRCWYPVSMSSIPIPTSHRDLLEAPIPVTLATVGPTGYPQLTAVWVVLEGDVIVTSLAGIRQKLKNLRERPLATVFVVDPANPYRTLEVRCDVTVESDPELATLVKVLSAYGMDLASFDAPLEGRVTVTLRPVHAVALG